MKGFLKSKFFVSERLKFLSYEGSKRQGSTERQIIPWQHGASVWAQRRCLNSSVASSSRQAALGGVAAGQRDRKATSTLGN